MELLVWLAQRHGSSAGEKDGTGPSRAFAGIQEEAWTNWHGWFPVIDELSLVCVDVVRPGLPQRGEGKLLLPCFRAGYSEARGEEM